MCPTLERQLITKTVRFASVVRKMLQLFARRRAYVLNFITMSLCVMDNCSENTHVGNENLV